MTSLCLVYCRFLFSSPHAQTDGTILITSPVAYNYEVFWGGGDHKVTMLYFTLYTEMWMRWLLTHNRRGQIDADAIWRRDTHRLWDQWYDIMWIVEDPIRMPWARWRRREQASQKISVFFFALLRPVKSITAFASPSDSQIVGDEGAEVRGTTTVILGSNRITAESWIYRMPHYYIVAWMRIHSPPVRSKCHLITNFRSWVD